MQTITRFDLRDHAVMEPLAEKMITAGAGSWLPLLGKEGAQWVSGLYLTPPRSGTIGKMPNAPSKQEGGDGNDSRRDLGSLRRSLRF